MSVCLWFVRCGVGQPHQKMTALDVNNEAMRDYLEEGGQCEHEPGEHQPIEGSVHFRR